MSEFDNARVVNNSSRPVLVGVPDREGGYVYYRLMPSRSSPLDQAVEIVCAAEPNVLIRSAPAWQIRGPVVAYIMNDNSALSLACSACEPLTAAPRGRLAAREESVHWSTQPGEVWVTVLGGGITGLSAAHELVARGFHVQVIDKNHQSPEDSQRAEFGHRSRMQPPEGPAALAGGLSSPDVGGIARTQWATMPSTRRQEPSSITHRRNTSDALQAVHAVDWYGATPTDRPNDRALRIPFSGAELQADAFMESFRAWFARLQQDDRAVVGVQLVVIVYSAPNERAGDACGASAAYARLAAFRRWLEAGSAAAKRLQAAFSCLVAFPVARLELTVDEPPSANDYTGLLLRHHEHLGLIPGEHGFRFFPGFYRHLRDTMKRTPLFDAVQSRFTNNTVHDNLAQVVWQVLVDPKREHAAAFARRSFPTVGALFEQYRSLRQDLGYRPSDLMRFMLRIGRYMTSSSERRAAHYEQISWWDFLSVRDLRQFAASPPGGELASVERLPYGARFSSALRHSPLALVAMKAETCDARTQGNITVQLGMSQFNLHEFTDSTLNGPTSDSWFRHWHRYLEAMGVRFFVGDVTQISSWTSDAPGVESGSPMRRIDVQIAFPEKELPEDFVDAEAIAREDLLNDATLPVRHYYISALDVVGLQRATGPLRAEFDLGYRGVISSLGPFLQDPEQIQDIKRIGEGPLSRFQTLTGIQFYYRPQVSFADGHIYFAESPWGLSGISQVQYWGTGGDRERNQLLSNFSIDIGSWRATAQDSEAPAPDPNTMSRDDIAREVLKQIAGAPWQASQADHSDYYHLDDYIQFCLAPDVGQLRPKWNRAPYLINVVGEWGMRPPGEPWVPNDRAARGRSPGAGSYLLQDRNGRLLRARGSRWTPVWQHDQGGYMVHYDNLVFSGTHMRTFTRMGTMEAANESARHAVNALLDHLVFTVPTASPELAGSELDRASSGPYRMPTKYGDYCNIWDPEAMEIADLDFLRVVDKHLMAAERARRKQADDVAPGAAAISGVAPHLFDLLRVDELPDLMDGDGDALKVFELMESGFKAFSELSRQDVPSALAIVDQLRRKVESLISSLRA